MPGSPVSKSNKTAYVLPYHMEMGTMYSACTNQEGLIIKRLQTTVALHGTTDDTLTLGSVGTRPILWHLG